MLKKKGATWSNFFQTLPMKLTKDCLTTGTAQTFCTGEGGTLQFYLNGQKNTNALDEEIRDGNKLLVTFGEQSESQIQQQFDQIENPSN